MVKNDFEIFTIAFEIFTIAIVIFMIIISGISITRSIIAGISTLMTNVSDPKAYDAIKESSTFKNDNQSQDLKQIYKGDVYDSSMPYLYVFEFHNTTGWHYASVYIDQHDGNVSQPIYDYQGYKWIMDKYGDKI